MSKIVLASNKARHEVDIIGYELLIMRSQFPIVLYSVLFLINFSNADPDVDTQTANYARSIISFNHGIEKANFDSDADDGATNLAPFSDQRDDSSFALPVLLSDAECSQDINGKFDKEQLMQICPSDYRQTPQGSSTGWCDQVGEVRA